jgi:hypothetical protein
LDTLTITLVLSIGCAVAWLFALYSARGPYLLFWDMLIGTIGAGLCALGIVYFVPIVGVAGLVMAGPLCAAFLIVGSHAVRRAIVKP